MLSFIPRKPYKIGLITTFRCNAACDNCCFGCRPERGRTMTIDEMKHYVDICMDAYPDSIKYLDLTGGECFLLGNDLDEIVSYGKERGLSVALVSNGYWGKSYSSALERIIKLKAAGLKSIAFSVGDDHQHILPLKGCRNAAVASARVGYKVEFRMETQYVKCSVYEKLKEDSAFMRLVNAGKIDIVFWKWREYNNDIWKTQARMTPAAKVDLTPENNLFLTPEEFGRRGQFYFGLSAFEGFEFTDAFTG